jgi:Flp pilus assembly protein CpaB
VTYNVRNIAIAVILAIAAAAVVLVYTTSYRQSVTRGQKRVDVMVASRDIVAGTPAEEASGAMTLTSVLADDKAPGALSTTAGLEGKVTGQTIYAGQQIVAATFGTSLEQATQLQLTKTDRALRVMCEPKASCLIGDVKAGDKVDVFETIEVDAGVTGNKVFVTRMLLSAVKVLAIPDIDPNAKGGLAKGSEKNESTVMLMVDQAKATKLAWLGGTDNTRGGQVWLAVRPPDAVAQDVPIVSETPESMILDGLPAADAQKLIATLQGKGRITSTNTASGATQTAKAP